MSLKVIPFYHQPSHTLSYLVYCHNTRHAAVIDSVADIQESEVAFTSADKIIAHIKHLKLDLKWLIETHVHADHLSACQYIKQSCGGKTVVGERISEVQKTLSSIYNIDCAIDGSQFDVTVSDGQVLPLGEHSLTCISTPGHTPDGISIYTCGHVFIGDTLFMPDSGSARCDFPHGSAQELYESIVRLLALPADTKVWVCHDYQPMGRALDYHCTIGEQLLENVHLQQGKAHFVNQRQQRDLTLNKPKLMDIAVPFNMQGACVALATS